MIKPTENGPTLLGVILQFFQEDQWHYQVDEQKPVVRAGFHGEHGTWICFARCDEENERVIFHSNMGLNIPPEYRLPVAEYLTRANYGIPAGNFEMDLDTGDVRFKTCLEAPPRQVTVEMIRRMAYANVHAMDRYFSGVVAVIHTGLSPEAALARVERQAEGIAE